MAQVVIQDFELQGIPPPLPRPAEHPIDKLPPQLTKGGFNLLSHLTEDEAVSWGSIAGNEQQVCRFRQFCRAVVASVAQITKSYSSIDSLDQSQGSGAVIPIARRQEDIEHPPVHMAQQMKFKAKAPPVTGFAKVRSLLTHHHSARSYLNKLETLPDGASWRSK
jgi:hypothetical protein